MLREGANGHADYSSSLGRGHTSLPHLLPFLFPFLALTQIQVRFQLQELSFFIIVIAKMWKMLYICIKCTTLGYNGGNIWQH